MSSNFVKLVCNKSNSVVHNCMSDTWFSTLNYFNKCSQVIICDIR